MKQDAKNGMKHVNVNVDLIAVFVIVMIKQRIS